MGCDIHLFVETRDSANAPWELTRVESKCDWCEGSGKNRDASPCYGCRGSGVGVGFSSRNYDTFAVLANVRNGSGFAGVDTGDGFVPISEPRDLPDDMSAELRAIQASEGEDDEDGSRYDRLRSAWGASWLGDHSHSHVTLAELLAYDWTRRTNKRGEMTLGAWKAWKESGAQHPKNYCGGASGSAVRHVNETVATELARCIKFSKPEHEYGDHEPLEFKFDDAAVRAWETLTSYRGTELAAWQAGTLRMSIYVPVQWTMTYAECSALFHDRFIPALVALGKDPANVRLVFGFDS
jgi:hypothetical protein